MNPVRSYGGYSQLPREAQALQQDPRETTYQPLAEARVIRCAPQFVGYSPASQMAQPCWPPQPEREVGYQVLGPVVDSAVAVQPLVALQAKPMRVARELVRLGETEALPPPVRVAREVGSYVGAVSAVQYLSPGSSNYVVPDPTYVYQQQQQPLEYIEPTQYYMNEQQFTEYMPEIADHAAVAMDELQSTCHVEEVGEEEAAEDYQTADGPSQGNQFMSLLESLEARVDLMAQMQHTRAAIQKRARAIEMMRSQQQLQQQPPSDDTWGADAAHPGEADPYLAGDGIPLDHEANLLQMLQQPLDDATTLLQQEIQQQQQLPLNDRAHLLAMLQQPLGDASAMLEEEIQRQQVEQPQPQPVLGKAQLLRTLQQPLGDAKSMLEQEIHRQTQQQEAQQQQQHHVQQLQQLQQHQQQGQQRTIDSKDATSRLAQENAELWAQFEDQRNIIAQLTGAVEGMRHQLSALAPPGVEAAGVATPPAATSATAAAPTPPLQPAAPIAVPTAASLVEKPLPALAPPTFSPTAVGTEAAVGSEGGPPSYPGSLGVHDFSSLGMAPGSLSAMAGSAAAAATSVSLGDGILPAQGKAGLGGGTASFGGLSRGATNFTSAAVDVDVRAQLKDALTNTQAQYDLEARRLEQQLQEERRRQESSAQQWIQERKQLYAQIGEARAASCDPRTSPVADIVRGGVSGTDRAKSPLQNLFPVGSDMSPFKIGALSDIGEPKGEVANILVSTTQVPRQDPSLGQHTLPSLVPPFSRQTCGVNLTLSEDGYTATRTRGCRQSVVVGSGPLERRSHGWFYEVVVCETVTGWVGGLGIGVTRTPPGQLRRVPDKAWRLPSTCIVGYWGCVFLDGKERRTRWRSDTLSAGARVGLLVTDDGQGDLIIFVDDVPVVRAQGALLAPGADGALPAQRVAEPLYPVVDVFAATRVVSMSQRPTPPLPPWEVDASTLSPPGSPVSLSMRSVRSSTASAMGFGT